MPILIEMPLPAKELQPNSRCHWAAKARAVKYARDLAFVMARRAGVQGLNWKRATMQATFHWSTKAIHDADNAMASLKSACDGITSAGLLVNDSGLIPLPPVMSHDKRNPRVVLEFNEVM